MDMREYYLASVGAGFQWNRFQFFIVLLCNCFQYLMQQVVLMSSICDCGVSVYSICVAGFVHCLCHFVRIDAILEISIYKAYSHVCLCVLCC